MDLLEVFGQWLCAAENVAVEYGCSFVEPQVGSWPALRLGRTRGLASC